MATKVNYYSDDKITSSHSDEVSGIIVEDPDVYFEIEDCAKEICNKNYQNIALQFPDELMLYSHYVSSKLKKLTHKKIFVLADTSYGSCCVDEVAASHYNADVIIHYGRSCLSNTEKIPVLYVFGSNIINQYKLTECIHDYFGSNEENILLFFDVSYNSSVIDISQKLQETFPNMVVSKLCPKKNCDDSNSKTSVKKFGREYVLTSELVSYKILYIGEDSRTLYNLLVSYNRNEIYSYTPVSGHLRKEDLNVNKYLMRRYYLIEKAKDAQIVGIVMGTLGVARYKEMVSRLKKILKLANKKFYTFVVGKVNTPKLANFMEIDIFVLIACPENSLIDSRDFYKPIITPFEMEIACLKSRTWSGDYVTDFRDLLQGSSFYVDIEENEGNERENDDENDVPEFSFITGRMRSNKKCTSQTCCDSNSNELVLRNQETTIATVQPSTAGEYLSVRMWQGLQVDSGNSEVTKATDGRSGIAMNYVNEPEQV